MSEFDDTTNYEDPSAFQPEESDLFAEEPADVSDDGWSPVMGTPPPDLATDTAVLPDEAPADLPPHELPDVDRMTPPPGVPGDADLGAPPPPPVTDGTLPDVAPMPPVDGDVDLAPPAADAVDLAGGPPIPPDAPGTDPVAGPQSPVPQMGDVSAPLVGDVDLGDGGPPMPPGIDSDTPAPPPGSAEYDPIELPTSPDDPTLTVPDDVAGDQPADALPTDALPTDGVPTDELPTDELPTEPDPTAVTAPEDVVLTVDAGSERVAAAAVAGVLLDQMGADEPARQRLIEMLEASAADGTITIAEVEAALLGSGMESTPTGGTEEELVRVLCTDDGCGRAAIAAVPEEGPGVFRARYAGDTVELESMRTGSVYAAPPSEVARAWRDSGSTLLGAPAPVEPAPAPDAVAAEPAAATEDVEQEGGGLRNVLLAGAVLLPLAGGATFMATRKIR
jgi:hypothetical protein